MINNENRQMVKLINKSQNQFDVSISGPIELLSSKCFKECRNQSGA